MQYRIAKFTHLFQSNSWLHRPCHMIVKISALVALNFCHGFFKHCIPLLGCARQHLCRKYQQMWVMEWIWKIEEEKRTHIKTLSPARAVNDVVEFDRSKNAYSEMRKKPEIMNTERKKTENRKSTYRPTCPWGCSWMTDENWRSRRQWLACGNAARWKDQSRSVLRRYYL